MQARLQAPAEPMITIDCGTEVSLTGHFTCRNVATIGAKLRAWGPYGCQ